MVRNNRRKAFTIVELVIVIAVIAILAAVMIPTFTGIIKRANISADQQLAASINTQLSIYKAEGNKIETEADLIKALTSDENFTAQLNPKSAKHGYHYWYDAAEQTVKLLSNDQVLTESAKLRERVQAQVFAAGGDGVAVAAFNPLDFAHAAPRSIVPGLYFLDQIVDGKGNEISNFFAVLDGKEALGTEYLEALTDLTEVKGDNKNLADAIVARMKATVVISNSGVFYHAETTANAYYYFIPGTTSVKATQYKFSGATITPVSGGNLPTPKDNKIVLPSSVLLVEKNALNFATANSVTVVTFFETPEDLAEILAADCSNAIFTILNGNAYIVNGNELHINGGAKVCDLAKRLPFSDFRIAIANSDNPTLYTISGNDEKGYTLYVLMTQSNGNVTLIAKDAAEGSAATSSEVNEWVIEGNNNIQISSTGVLTFDPVAMQQSEDYTATITANAINNQLDNETNKVSHDITVEVVRATEANVIIDGLKYALGQDQEITLEYRDGITYDVVLDKGEDGKGGATYSTNGFGTNSLTITAPQGGAISVANNQTLSFTIDENGNATAEFTVSVDGCLETTFYVNLNNTNLADYEHTFYAPTDTPDRPFYIGEYDPISLSSFLRLKEGNPFVGGVTITIFDELQDLKLHNLNQINKTNNGIELKFLYGDEEYKVSEWYIDSQAKWDGTKIQFNINEQYFIDDTLEGETVVIPEYYDIYVQITDKDNYSTVVKVRILKDAENVTGAEFETLGTVSRDVVLNSNATVTSGKKIDLGANTLYGNGYIIDATSYLSTNATNVLHDYFISVSGGTIDNVYIEGPVYPVLDYNNNNNKYYVSGIKVEAGAKASTVQYSYVSGFRQPIALYDGTLNVIGTTLYGGNYANLQLLHGVLNLENVTTVQPNEGIDTTVGAAKKVIGLGIVVEKDAINGTKSEINIKGYLDQYNWVSSDTEATLPVVEIEGTTMDFQKVLAALFKGVRLNVLGETKTIPINFVENYLYTNNNGKQCMNTGIMFMAMGTGTTASDAKAASANFAVNDSRKNTAGNLAYKALTPQPLPLFSQKTLYSNKYANWFLGLDDYGVTAAHAMRMLPACTIDGEGYLAGSITKETFQGLASPIDVYISVWSYTKTNPGNFGPDTAVYTGGYYANYGK